MLELRDDYTERDESHTIGPNDPQSRPDATNLRPPESVCTVQLVSVLISLDFSAASTNSGGFEPKSFVQEPWTSTAQLLAGEDELNQGEPMIEDPSANFVSLLENDDFGPWNPATKANDAGCPILPNPNGNTKNGPTNSATIVALTDMAIRSFICPRIMRRPDGIMPCEDNNLFHLANLAPSIFIPGYRQAVQGRVKLIPTIAKFLSRFLQQSGQTYRFGEGTDRSLASFNEHVSDKTCASEQEEAIEGHLWMSLANGVKNAESARILRPLHVACTDRAEESPCRTFEDLLDTWHAFEEDYTTWSLEDDFEELHLDEEGFADEDEYFSDLYDEVLSSYVEVATKDMPQHFTEDYFEVLSNSPSHDGMLSATSKSQTGQVNACAHVADTRPGKSLLRRTNKDEDFPMRPYSSDSKLNEAGQIRLSPNESLDVIGGDAYTYAYVSRLHPSYVFEDMDDRALPLLLEQVDRQDFQVDESILAAYKSPLGNGDQDVIEIEEDQNCTALNRGDPDTEMPSYENSNRSSLTDIIGGDHLLWQMWTKRRASMIQTDEDMLEMHAMYAQDPDMRLLDTQKTVGDNAGEDYMLDSETSKASSINSSASMGGERGSMFHYGPQPVPEPKHHHFHLHKDSSPASSVSSSSRPATRQKLSRGQSFLKRLSGGRSSMDEASSASTPFSRDEPRDIEIKRRKTLVDYEKELEDNDDMLLR